MIWSDGWSNLTILDVLAVTSSELLLLLAPWAGGVSPFHACLSASFRETFHIELHPSLVKVYRD